MVDYTSIDYCKDKTLLICAVCENLQYETEHPLDGGGKFAWMCRNCGTVVEGDQVHLLQKTARFKPKNGI